MVRKLTCIICPLGCELTVQTEGKNVVDVKGNTCPKFQQQNHFLHNIDQ